LGGVGAGLGACEVETGGGAGIVDSLGAVDAMDARGAGASDGSSEMIDFLGRKSLEGWAFAASVENSRTESCVRNVTLSDFR